MKQFILVPVFVLYALAGYSQQQVSITVQGHADDWQLFMSRNIVEDLSFGKVVIITVTAGDSGHGSSAYGNGNIPYFMAREKGAVYSSKFASDLSGKEVSEIPVCSMVEVNRHRIARYRYKDNIVNYFLRLPDGLKGDGAPETGNQSLKRLKNKEIQSITAIDHSATYKDWSDLTQTIKSIILAERGTDDEIWMNLPSTDKKYNHGDHTDHYYSSLAAQDAVVDLPWVGIVSWMLYRSKKLPGNLSPSEQQNATAIFAVFSWSIVESGYVTCFEKQHTVYLPGDYFLITRKPTGGSFSGKLTELFESVKHKLNSY
ncbi:MAG: hypothetical protein Q8N05_18745 [Bacteroidota bacterium]|nr:hypothetical protein [Bacteroidota bacterium]